MGQMVRFVGGVLLGLLSVILILILGACLDLELFVVCLYRVLMLDEST
jgi:hypothetical protein